MQTINAATGRGEEMKTFEEYYKDRFGHYPNPNDYTVSDIKMPYLAGQASCELEIATLNREIDNCKIDYSILSDDYKQLCIDMERLTKKNDELKEEVERLISAGQGKEER